MAKSLALGARHHGGSSPLYPTNACVVQLVEFRSPKPKMKVRVLTCVQQYPSGGMVYTAVLETVSKGVSVRVRPWVHIVL
jgi:hypothetical protein